MSGRDVAANALARGCVTSERIEVVRRELGRAETRVADRLHEVAARYEPELHGRHRFRRIRVRTMS